MLSCKDVTERASDYLDGELPFMNRLAVRLHLAMCRHCRRFVRQLRLTVQALELLGPPEDEVVPSEAVASFRRWNARRGQGL